MMDGWREGGRNMERQRKRKVYREGEGDTGKAMGREEGGGRRGEERERNHTNINLIVY